LKILGLDASRIGAISLSLAFVLPIQKAYGFDFDTEPAASLEFRQGTALSVRSVTNQSGVDPTLIDSKLPEPFPRRDDGQGQLLWSTADQNAIAEHVAISADGNWVAIGYTLNDERLEVRNGSDGELEFSFPVETGGSWVAISGDGEVIAYSALDSVWLFTRDMRERPFMRFGMDGYSAGPLALSLDGSRLIATGIDPNGQTNRIWGFDREQGVGDPLWSRDVDANEAFYWYGANITPDGAVAVVNGKFHLYVVNAENGDLIWDAPTYNTESPVAISDDGAILATASLSGRLRVFAPSEQGYGELWHYNFTGGVSSWVSACAISGDGSTVAAGTLDFLQNGSQGRLARFDTFGGGRPNWISNPLGDEIGSISMTRDGGIIAAVTWGDLNHEQPDLVVHERHSRVPFYRLTTQGSLSSVSIARDGSKVVASGKAVHNRVFGSGGQVHTVDLALQGAVVQGLVRLRDGDPLEGAEVTANNSPYHAQTDRQGRYTLRVETAGERQATITVRKPGFTFGSQNVDVAPDRNINDVNFDLTPADNPPQNLRASQGARNEITVTWQPYNGRFASRRTIPSSEIRSVVGNTPEPISITGFDEPAPLPRRDDPDDADSIRIYRSYLPGGPFLLLGSVIGDEARYVDRSGIMPGRRYYYTATAIFENGESAYSNESAGWADDRFMIWEADLQSMPASPNLDGSISDDEWEGAEVRDISDVLGYDDPDSAGTVTARIGFNDEDDQLYLAFSFYGLANLQERSGVGVYVDDNGDGKWSIERLGSEGNFWGYFLNGGPDMSYRSLTGGPLAIAPYYRFAEPSLAFSDERGYVEIEMAIPLGFHGPQEVTLQAPDKIIGLGLFAIQRDQAGNPIFNGWWPQDMFSIVSNPEQFARVHVPAALIVPPGIPRDLMVERDGDALFLNWTDPDTSVDGAALNNWDGIRIYRNGEPLTTVRAGMQSFTDEDILPGGWYEYNLSGYVLEDDVPFEGPKSPPVGMYASREPQVVEMAYDDGSAEQFYVVDFNGRDNRFAARFDIPGGGGGDTLGVFWIDLCHRGAAPIDLYLMSDGGGVPDERTGYRLTVTPNDEVGFQRFHFPGAQQPRIVVDPDVGAWIWAVMNYQAESPGTPALGVDESAPDEMRNMYYTMAGGWTPLAVGQLMMRIAVGIPPASTPGTDEPALPTKLVVYPNYPNPFNASTSLPFALPGRSALKLSLFDLSGRVVWVGKSGVYGAGSHTLPLNFNALPSGAYRLEVKSDFGVGGSDLQLIK